MQVHQTVLILYHRHIPITIYYEQSETKINLVNQAHKFDIPCHFPQPVPNSF